LDDLSFLSSLASLLPYHFRDYRNRIRLVGRLPGLGMITHAGKAVTTTLPFTHRTIKRLDIAPHSTKTEKEGIA
jgi:hypothetical protein